MAAGAIAWVACAGGTWAQSAPATATSAPVTIYTPSNAPAAPKLGDLPLNDAVSQETETNPPTVARCLAALDTWIIAQPKAVRPLPGAAFPLNQCEGIVIEGMGPDGADLGERASAFMASASGVQLPVLKSHTSGRTLALEMPALPRQFAEATGSGAELFDQIGDQGYALAIEGLQTNGVSISQATDLVFGYVLQLNAAVKRHGRRLMIAQGPLDSQGHLAGMGPKLEALPKDIIIGREFVHDPFTHPDLTRIANPGAVGQKILDTAAPALAILSAAALQAKRNRDNLEQWLFGVRCYAAVGRKLAALGRYQDPAVPRPQVADELAAVANEYESLRTEFKRLWLAEDRDNDGFQELVRRFSYTIAPCREKATALRGAR